MESKHAVKVDQLKKHPKENSNLLSDLFYCWTFPMIKTGLKKALSEKDIYQTLTSHRSTNLTNKLERAWNSQKNGSNKPSLWRAIWKVFKWDIMLSIFLYFVTDIVLKIIRLIALGILLGYYSPNATEMSKSDAIICASVIVTSSFLLEILEHAYILHFQQLAMKVRVACASLIYRKALKLSKKALSETTIGHIINLLSNDMQRLVAVWGAYHALWAAPLQAALILFLLYWIAGPTALVGNIFLLVLTPLQVFMTKKTADYRLKISLKSDERIRYMSEIISGIQVIKVYTWELPFVKLIDAIRRKEMYFIKIANFLDSITIAFEFFFDRTSVFICLVTYVLLGSTPDAQYVFVLASFYDLMMQSVSLYFPQGLTITLQANVAIKRFENFLNLHEIQNKIITTKETGITIDQVSAKWSETSQQNTLSDIKFNLEPKQLVAIIGPIGSGKSSLLQLCLGELAPNEGCVKIGGRISYANQEPWLFAGSVKQNILFGQAMVREKYQEVIRVCALEDDIAQFPYGDNTIVGERGILLSGGQKARINLARAIYKDADIYLLDDPLSAVDARVGKQIFNNCIMNYLKGKCTVLVTHQIQYLSFVDKIYLMVDGKVAVSGSYKELQASGEDFTRLLKEHEKYDESEDESVVESKASKEDKEQDEEEETWIQGKVSKKVYISYLRASGNYFRFAVMGMLFIMTEILATGSDYFITFWVNLEQKRTAENKTKNETLSSDPVDSFFTNENCIYVYTAIIGALILFSILRSMSFFQSCMKASVRLHDKMFTSVINATMKFFYTNSSGRILNRFAKDMGSIDETLPEVFLDALQMSMAIIGTVLAICIVSPWTLIPSIIIVIIMLLLRLVYLSTTRDVKRMESTNRSPIFAHLTESMKGLTTIRAYNTQGILEKEFDTYQDVHTSIYYMYLGGNRALAVYLDIVCVLYVFCITVIALTKETYAGNVGFMITQGMSMSGMFQWGIRQWSEMENQMTSVERVGEYIDVEREKDTKTRDPPRQWPEHGKIEFKSVSMRYSSNDPYVLKNLNISITPREKVGIVGRTGAGKSSLIAVLFRLVDFEGRLIIDDCDTKELSLPALRSKISIIPQEPILFSGTVRKNLDPFDQYQDDQIWSVLEKVKLKEFVASSDLGLHSNLAEGGSNFSVGQKQLICLARALLRDSKILILDEATANVDPHTDELLQKTIRENFENCTVLTIAHRLHTVMDSDKVLVMDDGKAVEFDHPHALLQKKGVFFDLVMETGKAMGANLSEIAQENYLKRQNLLAQ
ncbi:probable multidrug resistance-associated protein lethal(2)03659 [Tribolium castaneum]|uniref:Putative multidrug resistance-associated protein lethal(2)03659-like Protein n=1 Tax=Tribolium castaneum TaxID=7070 RepID=D6WK73_TRICA|nr:PREDICTED: probable multidrug resistance-associated protein lethal(2)03659 [Tribolium castaneum]EFA03945.1 putative multidrug resistance-associated protein lethal(2)03659-like Protein [Tribolium castaneum]|eukprot:XP_008193216.1 PREDICTED: probable multidrug resistance-associated protein lethal(2)03659 [Tribolium castaneum]